MKNNMSRRQFLKTGGLALAAMTLSLIHICELPILPLSAGETGTMIGYHAVSVIADAYMKGIRGFDAEKALEAMVVSSEKRCV